MNKIRLILYIFFIVNNSHTDVIYFQCGEKQKCINIASYESEDQLKEPLGYEVMPLWKEYQNDNEQNFDFYNNLFQKVNKYQKHQYFYFLKKYKRREHLLNYLTISNTGKYILTNLCIKIFNENNTLNQTNHILNLYNFFKNNIYHPPTQECNTNVTLLYENYGNCISQSKVFINILRAKGIPSHLVFLEGHVVVETFYKERYALIDPDQNVFYQLLNEEKIASFPEIINDPFLVTRTKMYGRYFLYDPVISAQASSIFLQNKVWFNIKRFFNTEKTRPFKTKNYSFFKFFLINIKFHLFYII